MNTNDRIGQMYSRKQTDNSKKRSNQQQRNILIKPKWYVLFTLILTTVIALVNGTDVQGSIANIGVAVVTAIFTDGVIGLYQQRKHLFSDGGVVTGLIVALVLSSITSWYITAVTTMIAILSKHVLKIKRKPIFNPAALGLLISIPLFSSVQSWWGALSEMPVWYILFLLIGGFLVTNRVNKFPQAFAFLGVYFTLLLILGFFNFAQAGDALRVPFINSALFLAFFMLTDPPTSPGKYKDQIIFGCVTAIVGVAIFMMFGGLVYLLAGLLVANAWNALRIYKNTNI